MKENMSQETGDQLYKDLSAVANQYSQEGNLKGAKIVMSMLVSEYPNRVLNSRNRDRKSVV